MDVPTIGLLPLYLKLYDEVLPELCVEMERFRIQVVAAFSAQGVRVVEVPICRLKNDIADAVQTLEDAEVDLLVTLHLAYSPSLEAVEVLVNTSLPILMLDTTPDESFGIDVDPERLLYNHGIHGLQDLASMLRRNGKRYTVVAGHLNDSRTMARACAIAQGARAATKLGTMRALRVGPTFPGMGDFQVSDSLLEQALGIKVDEINPEALLEHVLEVSEDDITAEMHDDLEMFTVDADPDVHRRSLRLGLGLRRYMTHHNYGAFSMNFLAFNNQEGPLSTVPFLECSKAMARGIGYAGEGDVLTASLVAALDAGIGPTTFTEMFCPDWAGGALFLSHMGEFNPAVAAEKPRLYEKAFPFTDAQNPVALACAPRAGAATLVTLVPGPNDSFGIVVAPVDVLGDGTHPDCQDWIRGWIKPAMPLTNFLEAYSEHGGTHHCALVMRDCREALVAFAHAAGLGVVVLESEGVRHG